MKNLNRFRKRNIQTNITHFLLVIFVVAVSVCLITGLFISHLTFKNAVENFYSNSNLPSLWIETDGIRAEDELLFAEFEYDKRLMFDSKITFENGEFNTKVIVSSGETSIPYLIEGEKGSGCYIDSKFIEKHKLGINYSVISFDYTYAGQTEKLTFKLLGSMALAEDLAVDDECVLFVDEEVFIEALNYVFPDFGKLDLSAIEYNQILIRSELGEEDIEKIQEYYQNSESELISLKTKDEVSSFQIVENEIQISQLMLWSFPLLFITVVILIVVSTISDLVAKERHNIGLLKSLGIKNREILSNYCGYGVFMCFVGAVLGVLISPLIVPNMTFETYDIIFNLPHDEVKMVFPFSLAAIIIFVSVFVGYFSSFFVCLRLMLKTPKECMIGSKKIKLKSRKKSKNNFGKIGSAFKNMKINRTRTVMSIVGISGCSMLGIIGFGLSLKDGAVKTNKYLSLEAFLTVFQSFSMVVLCLTILILSMQIFKERSREMAMLRINGKSYVSIWLSLMIEMLVVVLIGYIVAGLLSYPILMLMSKLFGIFGEIYISFAGFLNTFLIVSIVTAVICGFVIVKIYKINLVDSIKFSE